MRAKVRMPTPEEDAEINRGIAQDPDNPELDDDFFARARPAKEVMPAEVYAELVRRRGKGVKPAKITVALRLDPRVVEALRATGPGWHGRAGAALAKLVGVEVKE